MFITKEEIMMLMTDATPTNLMYQKINLYKDDMLSTTVHERYRHNTTYMCVATGHRKPEVYEQI